MSARSSWTRQQLLVAFDLYCRTPFGRLHSRNPEIVGAAKAIGRTPSAPIERYEGRPIRLPEKFALDQDLLSYHRTHVFQY